MTITILALDLGTKTGWAIHKRDGAITSGTQSFAPKRFDGGGVRYLNFKRWLTEMKNTAGGFDYVQFEEVRRHAGVDAAHAYGGFMATLTAWCEHHEIPYSGVGVGIWKKVIIGKGNAAKEDVIRWAVANGFRPEDDNNADALAILHFAMLSI